MDELPGEGDDKKLNRSVAISVVILSVFLGLCHIKDDNLVQAMQQAKADAVDTWSEYQATKTKLHITQGAADQLLVLGELAHDRAAVAAQTARLAAEVAKYKAEIPQLQAKARGFEASYDAMNYHDDQFDAADALVGIAVSVAAVAALAASWWTLGAAWIFGALGILMGVAGFAGWAIHPDFLARLLS
jgi:hypothetical protein